MYSRDFFFNDTATPEISTLSLPDVFRSNHPYPRHPAINYNAMATLHEMSGGRAKITVGAGDRPVMELGYRIAPVATVREMIGAMRALEKGDTANFDGNTVTLKDAHLSDRKSVV